MQVPRPTMDKDLQAEEKSLTDDINNLTKKARTTGVHLAYNQADAFSVVKIFRETVQRRSGPAS